MYSILCKHDEYACCSLGQFHPFKIDRPDIEMIAQNPTSESHYNKHTFISSELLCLRFEF